MEENSQIRIRESTSAIQVPDQDEAFAHPTIVSIKITDWTTNIEKGLNKRYTAFIVQVHLLDDRNFRVERRYSDFRKLHKLLKRRYATVRLLDFPSKRIFGTLALRVIERRKEELERYLSALLSVRPRPTELGAFFQLDYFSIHRSSVDIVAQAQTLPVREDDKDNSISVQRFELLKVLGKGSFGKVYLVRDRVDSQHYAMKVLSKAELQKRNQVDHTMTEKAVMSRINHPFIVPLRYAFQTTNRLYLVSEFCVGGEIFFHMKRFRTFSEPMVRFYAAELISVLEHLHSQDILYRDMKPENILLDSEGHVRLTDFGLSKMNVGYFKGASTFCGTPEYLAPEMIHSKKFKTEYGLSVDYWGLGAVLFEMLTGWPPFYDQNVKSMCERISSEAVVFPTRFGISAAARSLITGLLDKDPKKRLGCRIGRGIYDVKEHPFFEKVDWDRLQKRGYRPPFQPRFSSPSDIVNFDKDFTKERLSLLEAQEGSTIVEDENFLGFDFASGDRDDGGENTRTNRSNSIS